MSLGRPIAHGAAASQSISQLNRLSRNDLGKLGSNEEAANINYEQENHMWGPVKLLEATIG